MNTKLSPEAYWKLRTQLLEITVAEQRIIEARNRVLREAGLDPGVNYTLNDESTSATVQEN